MHDNQLVGSIHARMHPLIHHILYGICRPPWSSPVIPRWNAALFLRMNSSASSLMSGSRTGTAASFPCCPAGAAAARGRRRRHRGRRCLRRRCPVDDDGLLHPLNIDLAVAVRNHTFTSAPHLDDRLRSSSLSQLIVCCCFFIGSDPNSRWGWEIKLMLLRGCLIQ